MTTQTLLEPPAAPVGHRGAGVDIHERSAGSISGWWGVLGVAVAAGVAVVVAESSVPGWAALPVSVAVVLLISLAVVQPGRPGSCSSSAATSAPSGGPGCPGCVPLSTAPQR